MRALMGNAPENEKLRLSVEPGESSETAARLGADIAARFGPRDETPLAVTACDVNGAPIGGLNGVTHWRWLYIRHLWVAEDQRRAGLADRVITLSDGRIASIATNAARCRVADIRW